ncbi:MAG: DNA polymerase III subunit alpha [Candidatus Eremiobacteraeota bacterium]|nr:DNA polymerase III subunit alpha [Candidatus Eremiobacteraeota bacterium]MBC5826102.1 DNA polymerase III subunit alpha [Candidatus Eremiobacteraeota bacterium]
MPTDYAELHCHSNFTFLDGGSHPEELIARASALGLAAIAITDRDGLYGAVRFAQSGRAESVAAIIGAELTLEDESHLTVLAADSSGYANLSRLISRAHLDQPRGRPRISYAALSQSAAGLIALSGCEHGAVAAALARGDFRVACSAASTLRDIFGRDDFLIELQRHLLPDDGPRIGALAAVGNATGIETVATGGVHYAVPDHRELSDVLCCIRQKTTLEQAGTRLRPNGEYYLRSPAEMARLFFSQPQAIRNSIAIAQRCAFRLEKLRNEFPKFPLPPGETAFSYLKSLIRVRLPRRYRPVSGAVRRQIDHELAVIEKLDLAGYFLIVWDIVRFAEERKILVQGRGSAANSAVCYVLGITNVDPIALNLLFERFLSEERDELPDIDLDTPSGDQREQLIQYVYDRYGRDHAAMVAEVITYRARMAVRDVGKAIGLSLDQVDALAKSLDTMAAQSIAQETEQTARAQIPLPHVALGVTQHGERVALSAADVETALDALPAALKIDLGGSEASLLYALCRRIDGFPRHLSQHVGGMVITKTPLIEVAPLEQAAMRDRTILCWDKDDCGAMGLIKIDILGLGMLNAIELALAEIRRVRGVRIDLADLRSCDDACVYEMLCAADTVGLFQVESRAQMASLPRLKPRCFYDIVVQVAIIRPGPIQGDMVHPYIRRRQGLEPVTYPHPKLKTVLERTLGVPLFQEQGMRMAVEAAGFSAGQADELRRAMGHKRSREKMVALHGRLLDGMEKNGIGREVADRLFHMLSAFADYGFPESHAASFALIVYISGYLKVRYPAEFYASLINAQPMGFYSPAQLVSDARRHGLVVLPPDVNASRYECTAERYRTGDEPSPETIALRVGLNQVRGINERHKEALNAERAKGPYRSLDDFVARMRLPRNIGESLAAVGAFGCFELSRREALWEAQRLAGLASGGELARAMSVDEPQIALPAMRPQEKAAADFWGLGLSTRYQAMQFYRRRLAALGVYRATDLPKLPNRLVLKVAGVVTTRQRPGTAKGFVFATMEDETGLINVIVRPDIYLRYRPIARDEPAVIVEGVLQKEDGTINIVAKRFWKMDIADLSRGLSSRDFH